MLVASSIHPSYWQRWCASCKLGTGRVIQAALGTLLKSVSIRLDFPIDPGACLGTDVYVSRGEAPGCSVPARLLARLGSDLDSVATERVATAESFSCRCDRRLQTDGPSACERDGKDEEERDSKVDR